VPVRRRLLTALLAGAVLAAAFEPVTLPWVIPVVIAARLLALRGLSARAALLPGFAFGVAFAGLHLWWMQESIGTGAWVGLAGAIAVFLTLLGVIDALLLRLRAWPLWTSLSWIAVEWVRGTFPFGGMPWGRLSFAVADTPLAPALPYLGTAGVSFVLALGGALLAWLVLDRRDRRRRLRAVGALVLLCLALAVPLVRPWHGPRLGHLQVAAIQGNVPGDGDVLEHHREVTASHIALTEQLARDVAAGDRPRPDFVLWPENATATDPITDTATNDGIEKAVHAIGVPILVGGLPDAPDAHHVLNQGIVWDPVTGPGDRYTKHDPVPFGEYLPLRSLLGKRNFGGLSNLSYDMVAGTRTTPLRIDDAPVADAICFDIAFDAVVDPQIRHGGQLLTVQTSNASFIGTDQVAQQFAITRVQAMAAGRYAVVASLNGLSGVVAPDGRVQDTAPVRTQAVLDARVELIGGTTPAMWLGSRPGQVAAGLVLARLVFVASFRWRRRKTRREY
jgi:apolipoprotein N-acyltransferase